MKKKIFLIVNAAIISMGSTGCRFESKNNSEGEIKQIRYTPVEGTIVFQETKSANEMALDILIDAQENFVGNITLDGETSYAFEDNDLILTFPEECEGDIIFKDGVFYSRTAYINKAGSGAFMKITSSYVFDCDMVNTIPIGYDKQRYWYLNRITEEDYDHGNAEEAEEFKRLSGVVDQVVSECTCFYKDVFLPEGFIGELYKSDPSADMVYGYTSGYVVEGGAEELQWDMEEGWHITAVSAIYSKGKLWFDCYDTDDNDHYGWVKAEDILFYETEATENIKLPKKISG